VNQVLDRSPFGIGCVRGSRWKSLLEWLPGKAESGGQLVVEDLLDRLQEETANQDQETPDPLGFPQGHSPSLSIRSRKVTASGRPSAIAAPVRRDESIKVLNVVAGGGTHLDDGQLAPGHKTFNRRPGYAEVVGSGTDRQYTLASPLWLEYLGVFPRCLPLFARR
jgi:hypothetical protein